MRMVLAHTTGMPNWRQGPLRLAFVPGTGFEYSGEAYVYLGRVLEHVTGKDLEALTREEVFEPLGMTGSQLVWSAALAERNWDSITDQAAGVRPASASRQARSWRMSVRNGRSVAAEASTRRPVSASPPPSRKLLPIPAMASTLVATAVETCC